MPAQAGINVCSTARYLRMKRGYVYIITNKSSGTLYTGVTAHIAARVHQRRSGTGSDFCKRHGLTRLVLVEGYDTIEQAIAREKAIKAWKRSWKLNLIGRSNPDWIDLFPTLHLDLERHECQPMLA